MPSTKNPNSREPCFQTTRYGWAVGSVVPGRTSTQSRSAPGLRLLQSCLTPGPCPCLSLPGPYPAIRTSRLCLRATPRASAGSSCSQSARALRVTSPGPRINRQVAHRRSHSSGLIRREHERRGGSGRSAGAGWGELVAGLALPGAQAQPLECPREPRPAPCGRPPGAATRQPAGTPDRLAWWRAAHLGPGQGSPRLGCQERSPCRLPADLGCVCPGDSELLEMRRPRWIVVYFFASS